MFARLGSQMRHAKNVRVVVAGFPGRFRLIEQIEWFVVEMSNTSIGEVFRPLWKVRVRHVAPPGVYAGISVFPGATGITIATAGI